MSTSQSPPSGRHRFAPLRAQSQPSDGTIQLQGIIFDMDGTLCEPQNYMFGEMRKALGIPKSTDIIDHINSLPSEEQPAAWTKIEDIERTAMVKQVAQPGLTQLLEYLDQKNIRKGICTRNFDKPVNHLLANHVAGHIIPFQPVLTRSFKPPKPSPAGILHIVQNWGVRTPAEPSEKQQIPVIMVGDSIDDIVAGHDAGALTVLLASPGKEDLAEDARTDVVVDRLDELVELLEHGLNSRHAS
ncbi:hypothetical protein AMS68_000134 [Peltaster fructicola]|uniref:HAD superfamily hydrolase n=1 Tax=Peltaster fructicola TaxID=286661 RepID=A0A6H0XIR5_9PEZI|nr:hypothetical protein AMS68_000134 [Peltaster fructicola]